MTIAAFMLQLDAASVEYLARLATVQTVTMICMVIFVALALAAAVMSYSTLKTADRTLAALEKVIDELAPRAEPLLDGLTRIATDTAAVADVARRKLNDVADTIEDVNLRLRRLADAAEGRVREFSAVVDVVQAEAEEVLLDAAATARGIHHAAQRLRSSSADLPAKTATDQEVAWPRTNAPK